jgi:hypothetical protein
MGLWDNTAYIRCEDLDRVERALVELFGRERRDHVAMPGPRKPAQYDSMQYGKADENGLWGVALIPGGRGWTVIKTAPYELLCELPRGDDKPRFAGLTSALGVDGLQVNLYDGDSIVLLEASAGGEVAVSGFCSYGDDPEEWNGMPIGDRLTPEFGLIAVDPAVAAAIRDDFVEHAARRVQALLAGAEIDNRIQVNHLIPHHELFVRGARACFFRQTTVH